MDLVCVTVDCRNPGPLADFWSAALGWPAPRVAAGGGGAICRPAGGGPYLEFIRVPEQKTIKNRLHFGCTVGALDRFDPEFERLLALGAKLVWKEVFPSEVDGHYRNWILVDPEGNEFCLGGGTWPPSVPEPAEVPISLT